MESITLVAAGWSSGLNAYLTVLILGLSGRFGWVDTPVALQHNGVLMVAGAAFAVEFVIDKIPLLDSAWDLVHTLVRPVVGGMVGSAIAGSALGRPEAFAIAALLALTGHTAKATTRLAINMSPEPVTNVIASFSEDGIVLGLVTFAMVYPVVSLVLGSVAVVGSILVTLLVWRLARRGVRRVLSMFHHEADEYV